VQRIIAILVVTWCACSGVGLLAMLRYELTPAATTAVTSQWPSGTQLVRDSARPTLVLFLHPRCPCSRATLRELSLLEADCSNQFATQIVFVRPVDSGESWEKTDLCRLAERIPAAVVNSDVGGAEAARFGATTSGQAMLFSPDSRLLFQGGITSSRGHEGDNAGRTALTSLINTGQATCTQTAVFGCSLLNPSEATRLLKTDATQRQKHE
jgi:hypothetical protein